MGRRPSSIGLHRGADGSQFIADVSLSALRRGGQRAARAPAGRHREGRDRGRAGPARRNLEDFICVIAARLINLDARPVLTRKSIDCLQAAGDASRGPTALMSSNSTIRASFHELHSRVVSRERLGADPALAESAAGRLPLAFASGSGERSDSGAPGQGASCPWRPRRRRPEFKRQRIESLIVVPMALAGRVVGFIGFDSSVTTEAAWTEETVALLRVAANAVTGTLARKAG